MENLASLEWAPIVWALLGICGAAGLLALVSPRRFAALTQSSGQWVDTNKLLATLDKRYDVDRFVLPHSRWFGVAVVAGVAFLGYVYYYYGG